MKLIKFFLFTTIMGLCICMTSAYAQVASPYVTVTEDWDGATSVEFTIQTSFDDIVAFAVGNDYSFNIGALIDTDSNAPDDWTAGAIVDVQNEGWKIATLDFTFGINISYLDIPAFITSEFLDALTDYEYTSAFLYYSAGGNAVLTPETLYDGFSGLVYGEDSNYVALGSSTGIHTGEATSAVPVPGAAILLFVGLTGLVGIKRRR